MLHTLPDDCMDSKIMHVVCIYVINYILILYCISGNTNRLVAWAAPGSWKCNLGHSVHTHVVGGRCSGQLAEVTSRSALFQENGVH